MMSEGLRPSDGVPTRKQESQRNPVLSFSHRDANEEGRAKQKHPGIKDNFRRLEKK